MDNKILNFLQAYKSLDELCKQIFLSDRGVSEYIDEMNINELGIICVSCWDKDYRQLKRLRWIRNKLVHEINSFEDDLFSEEDIAWIETFRLKLIERTDPLVLLHKIGINRIETLEEHDKHTRIETSPHPPAKQKNSELKSVVWYALRTGVILLVIILLLLLFHIKTVVMS